MPKHRKTHAPHTSLVGTWKLLSRQDIAADGQPRIDPILGTHPIAYLMYDATGHFAVQFMRRDRTSPGGAFQQPADAASNNSVAINGYDAYFGRYAVETDETVTQELLGALSPSDVGKVVQRHFRATASELVIHLETTSTSGERITRTLRWERVA